MNCKVRFEGGHENVALAVKAMQDFNTVMPVPKEIGIYKMVPISEDYFYYLLSLKGLVSNEHGKKSLERFDAETEGMGESIVFCYKKFARYMTDYYAKYGACTAEAWKQKHWGVSEQPSVEVFSDDEIMLSVAFSSARSVIDMVCDKYAVTAKEIK